MKTIKREKCIICYGSLNEICSFKDFPIYMGVSDKPKDSDSVSDMVFAGCEDCGCIQLTNLIPLDVLYGIPHNSAIGTIWDKHHKEFFEFMEQYVNGNVVEIGGGNLKLAKHLENHSEVNKITVYDTNSYGDYESEKITLKEEFFSVELVEEDVDVIIHSHLLEHLYNPIEELKMISDILEVGSYLIMSVPLIDEMLKDNFTNAMNFEHTYMTSYGLIESMLNVSGFEIVNSRNFNPYNIFVVAIKTDKVIKNDYILKDSVNIFSNFITYHKNTITEITKQINGKKENTFIFGAHIFTQYLFGFGLDSKLFNNVLDNDVNKIGKRLYGTDLNVESPKILKDIKEPLVLLKAAQYTEEIKKDILENMNPNTKFIL